MKKDKSVKFNNINIACNHHDSVIFYHRRLSLKVLEMAESLKTNLWISLNVNKIIPEQDIFSAQVFF